MSEDTKKNDKKGIQAGAAENKKLVVKDLAKAFLTTEPEVEPVEEKKATAKKAKAEKKRTPSASEIAASIRKSIKIEKTQSSEAFAQQKADLKEEKEAVKDTVKEAAKKEAPKKEAAKKEAAEKVAPKKETAEKETAKKEAVKKETVKKEAVKKETVKKEAAKKETAKKSEAKTEALKKEAAEGAKKIIEMKKASDKKIAEVKEKVSSKKKEIETKISEEVKKKTTSSKTKKNVEVQFGGYSANVAQLEEKAKEYWATKLKKKPADLKELELYIKPEDRKVYLVFNKSLVGDINL